ncbi:hypothetical protein KIN20_015078 [Parelaphostrongylus tenuis]|uniref:Uncharacterized protein n=1 Tax=Parelaphostrongylus tenuis TaxID=148309 RepID=A0AAD5QPL8_PARTN|nr:hypothetical protein KIN20_015078 [Parelaphostrongylus tenuis]
MRRNEGIVDRSGQLDNELDERKHPYDALATPQLVRYEDKSYTKIPRGGTNQDESESSTLSQSIQATS